MKLSLRIALSLAALLPSAAQAADYDPPIFVEEADEYVPVEVGSGWYLRGDVGYAFSHPFEHEQMAGIGDETLFSDSSLFTGSIGMGYHFNDYFRGELNFGILPTNEFGSREMVADACEGTTNVLLPGDPPIVVPTPAVQDCEVSSYGENKGYSLMANAYVDLGTYVGITPYIGGGLGIAYNKYFKTSGERDCVEVPPSGSGAGGFFCNNPDGYGGLEDSKASYNLAYSLGAGLSYQVTKNVSVDIGYEYMAVPGAEYVAYDDGAFGIHEGIDYHSVKLGFRYDLW